MSTVAERCGREDGLSAPGYHFRAPTPDREVTSRLLRTLSVSRRLRSGSSNRRSRHAAFARILQDRVADGRLVLAHPGD